MFNTMAKLHGNIIPKEIYPHHLDTIKYILSPLKYSPDANISIDQNTEQPMDGLLSPHELIYSKWIIANYLIIIAIPFLHTSIL